MRERRGTACASYRARPRLGCLAPRLVDLPGEVVAGDPSAVGGFEDRCVVGLDTADCYPLLEHLDGWRDEGDRSRLVVLRQRQPVERVVGVPEVQPARAPSESSALRV